MKSWNISDFISLQIHVFLLLVWAAFAKDINVDKFAIVVIVLSLVRESRNQPFLINPYSLFIITPISLLLYWPISNFYMIDLSHKTYMLCIMHFSLIILIFNLKIPRHGFRNARNTGALESSRGLVISFLGYCIGFIGLFLPLISSFSWIILVFSLSVIYRDNRRFFILLFLIYFGTVISSFNISKLFLVSQVLFVAILIQQPRTTWRMGWFFYLRSILLCLILVLVFFRFGNKDRDYVDANSGWRYYARQGVEWNMSPSLFLPYMYVTTPWANLQYVLDEQDERTYGLWLVKPFASYLGLDNTQLLQLRSYSSFNTFTFIAVFFKDFGYFGSLVGTFILAHFIATVYRMYLKMPQGLIVGLYSIVALAVLQMYFSNHFIMQSYPVTAFLIYLLIIFLRKIFGSYGERYNNMLRPASVVGKGYSERK